LAGIGQAVNARFVPPALPEDFRVEELPATEPEGQGEHLWCRIEKRALSTEEAAGILARALGVPARAARWAGRKDVRAVTRQDLSLAGADPKRAETLLGQDLAAELPPTAHGARRLVLLGARAHPRALYLGQCLGNRFELRLFGVTDEALAEMKQELTDLERRGAPARFGAQRQGLGGRNQQVGFALLSGSEDFARHLVAEPGPGDEGPVLAARELAATGDYAAAAARFPRAFALERRAAGLLAEGVQPQALAEHLERRALEFLVSAAQSALFDRLLERREPDLARLIAGDVAFLHGSRGSFVVEDPALEQPRAERFEISPTGALFGRRMRPKASAAALAEELAVLAEAGLTPEHFERALPSRQGPWRPTGARRPLRWPLAPASLEREGADQALLCFTLPPGGYATEVLAALEPRP
jgi:tRNA pseudouridine13 synthase